MSDNRNPIIDREKAEEIRAMADAAVNPNRTYVNKNHPEKERVISMILEIAPNRIIEEVGDLKETLGWMNDNTIYQRKLHRGDWEPHT